MEDRMLQKSPVSEISCLILNDIGAVKLRTAPADCGHVGCGIVIVAYAHNLAVGECVEPQISLSNGRPVAFATPAPRKIAATSSPLTR